MPVKRLYETDDSGRVTQTTGTINLSPYLVPGGDVIVTARTRPLCPVPEIVFGSMPNDGGHLMLTPQARAELLASEPAAAKFIRPLLGAEEFINAVPRYCLWLADASPKELRALPAVMGRIESVRAQRLKSTRDTTRKLADLPTLFGENRQPAGRYLAIPSVSSERRRYVPMGFLEADTIANNLLLIVPGAELWHFGVLTSQMHLAWMRAIAGRLKSDYRYSNKLVYNNFPWPEPTAKQRAAIEKAAQAVLDARAPRLAAGASLADLYDPLTMPAELLRAHQHLDHAVEQAYRPAAFLTERERVEFLFARYEKLAAPLTPGRPAKTKRPRPKSASPVAEGMTQAEADSAHIYTLDENQAPYGA